VKEQKPLQERLVIIRRKVGEIPMADHLALISKTNLTILSLSGPRPLAVIRYQNYQNYHQQWYLAVAATLPVPVVANCDADSSDLSSLDSLSGFESEADKPEERAIVSQCGEHRKEKGRRKMIHAQAHTRRSIEH
jgi:hypothetical protein